MKLFLDTAHLADIETGHSWATQPFDLMDKLFNHPLTDSGNERFRIDRDPSQQALTERATG